MYEWFERANRQNETNSSKHFRLEINRNTFEKYQQQIPSKIQFDGIFDEKSFVLDFHGIDFGKFCDLIVPLITGNFNDHQLKEIFEKLDSNHDEYLNRNEFEDLLRLIGRSESIDQIKKYISLLTTNEELHFQGQISSSLHSPFPNSSF